MATCLSGCGGSVTFGGKDLPTVYIVALGPVPREQLLAAAREVDSFDVHPAFLAPIPIDPALGDLQRNQLVAEKVAMKVGSEVRRQRLKDDPLVIAITQSDMYVGHQADYRWAFSYPAPSQTVTLISTARMNPANYGKPANQDLLESRLRKMVARHLTYLVLRKNWSENQECVTYRRMQLLQGLDAMGTRRC
jgi:predicted Zn-dependent protease